MIKQIIDNIITDKVFGKYIYKHNYLSGCSTKVYPITIWSKDIEIQLNTDKNIFNKFIKRIVDKYDILTDGYFCKSDGSCPSYIKLIYKAN